MNKIVNLFLNPVFEVYSQFLKSALTTLINLDHLFQRHVPVIYVIYDSLSDTLCMLLSGFIHPEIARELTVGRLAKFDIEDSDNYLSNDNMLISLARTSLELLSDNRNIK